MQVFLTSTAGVEFLRALERSPNIRTTQTAVTFGVLGAGMLVCHLVFRQADGLLPFGIGAVILATAFGSSAIVSLAMHRRSGLPPDASPKSSAMELAFRRQPSSTGRERRR